MDFSAVDSKGKTISGASAQLVFQPPKIPVGLLYLTEALTRKVELKNPRVISQTLTEKRQNGTLKMEVFLNYQKNKKAPSAAKVTRYREDGVTIEAYSEIDFSQLIFDSNKEVISGTLRYTTWAYPDKKRKKSSGEVSFKNRKPIKAVATLYKSDGSIQEKFETDQIEIDDQTSNALIESALVMAVDVKGTKNGDKVKVKLGGKEAGVMVCSQGVCEALVKGLSVSSENTLDFYATDAQGHILEGDARYPFKTGKIPVWVLDLG